MDLLRVVAAGISSVVSVGLSIIHDKYLRGLVDKNTDAVGKSLFQDNYRRAHAYVQQEDMFQQLKGYRGYWANNFFRIFITIIVADKMGLFTKNL